MTVDTLPSWLSFQATTRHIDVAIRHKQLGIWQEKRWGELHRELLRLVYVLKEKGFARGDTLFLLSYPRPEALLLSIAAQWLGGVSAPLDPSYEEANILTLLRELQPAFIFAEGQLQVEQVLKLNVAHRLVMYADDRGLSSYEHGVLQSYSDLGDYEVEDLDVAAVAEPADDAFVFYRLDEYQQVELQKLTHLEMLTHGRELIKQEALTKNEEALTARGFAASGDVRYLLAPWLLAGFKLNFPESIETRDIDRRELGPTLVAGTRQTYQRLEALIESRLPLPGGIVRALFDWSLSSPPSSWWIRKLIAYWLIIRPLRDVIGFSRTRIPLLVGESLPEKSSRFFASLGIEIRNWPDITGWEQVNADASTGRSVRGTGNNVQHYLGNAVGVSA